MKAVPQIKAAYDWSTAAFDREVASAMAAGDSGSVERLAEKQDTVERGLFVLLFAQFESVVTEYFEHARDARVSVDDWSRRRGWEFQVTPANALPSRRNWPWRLACDDGANSWA